MNCSKCNWSNPETCRICRAEQQESEQITSVVNQIVQTRHLEFDPIENDPDWWKLHLLFHRN